MLQGIRPIASRQLAADLIAGATLAALAIPEVMGYARIAGMPVVTGLYTLLLPAVLFALFGSSRHLVVGADSATAAIMAAALAPLARPGSGEWVQYAQALALGCAVLLLVARVLKLAFLADFLSRTVLAGFLTGVGLQVALGEIPGILGIEAHGASTLAKLAEAIAHAGLARGPDVAISLAIVVFVLAMRRWAPRVPAQLLAVAGVIAASHLLGLPQMGVAVVGSLQGGLPAFTLPDFAALHEHASPLVPTVFAMVFVILAQSAATSRAYASKYGERFSEDADISGLALANAGAAFTGAFVVNGSPTKTQMVDSAGGRSQLAHLAMAAVVLLVLLFATGPIEALPRSALAAVVFLIGLDLLHVRDLRRIHAERPSEFWVALATAAAVVLLGVERAIILAMMLSLIDHVRRGYRPHNSVIVRGEDGHARLLPVERGGEYAPGLLVYRFGHSMYYANAEVLSDEVAALTGSSAPPLRWFVIDFDAVDDVDFTAGEALDAIRRSLAEKRIALKFLRPSPPVAAQLRRYGLVEDRAGTAPMFSSIREMRRAFEQSAHTAEIAAGARAT